ncbi:MAG TPA: RsmE family RNA methyltransferase [Candidatus Babeliales bacterium]|nr:RsmE family RNA methyltransferase [Candidatus Babeliales bacterium]
MKNIREMNKERHEFAFFIESLSLLVQKNYPDNNIIVVDEKLCNRMMNVLRLCSGDQCIFFDRTMYIIAIVKAFVGKKQIHILIKSAQSTIVLRPKITFLLPLLKRDDLESALYALAEIGVNDIQLISTQKTVYQWSAYRDSERADKILIAAAEQSKNFAYPTLKAPIPLVEALQKYSEEENSIKIFFDPAGRKFFDVMHMMHSNKPSVSVLLIGPEGDLSWEEKKIVEAHKFIFCALTPTVVRAVQATSLAAGFVRSLL